MFLAVSVSRRHGTRLGQCILITALDFCDGSSSEATSLQLRPPVLATRCRQLLVFGIIPVDHFFRVLIGRGDIFNELLTLAGSASSSNWPIISAITRPKLNAPFGLLGKHFVGQDTLRSISGERLPQTAGTSAAHRIHFSAHQGCGNSSLHEPRNCIHDLRLDEASTALRNSRSMFCLHFGAEIVFRRPLRSRTLRTRLVDRGQLHACHFLHSTLN